MATYPVETEKVISTENVYSDWIHLKGDFNFWLNAATAWVATVGVYRKKDTMDGHLVEAFTTGTQKAGFEAEDGVKYRFGVATGDYTSGNIWGRLSQ